MNLISSINFLLLNLAVVASSFLIILWLTNYRIHSFSKLLISIFILFCSHIIIVEVLLGTFGILSYKNVSIVVYIIFAILVLLLGKKVVKNLKIVKQEGDYPSFFSIAILFGPIFFLLLAKAFNAVLQIPLEYDSVAYHLPFVAEWLQTGTLNDLYYSAFSGPISYYPSNYELLDLWTFLPFRNDFFANLINFPLFVMLGIVIWRILRNFNIDKNTALISTAIPFYMPIFLHQAGLPLVDLFFTLFFAISIYFLQEISGNKGGNYSDPLLFGLSLGIFIGTKYLGLAYGAFLVLVLMVITIYKWKNEKISLVKVGIISFAGIFLTGSFFYIRNWVNSGNPLFPVEINILGFSLFEGYRGVNENLKSTSLLENFSAEGRIEEFRRVFLYIAGPYGLFSIFIPFVLFAFVAVKSFFKKRGKDLWIAILLALGILLYFYLYIKAPYTNKDLSQNIRYAMPFLLMGTIGIAYAISRIKFLKPVFYLSTAGIFIFSLIFLIINPPELVFGDRLLIDYDIILTYRKYFLLAALSITGLLYFFRAIFSKFHKNKLKIVAVIIPLIFSAFTGFHFLNFAYVEREQLISYWSNFWFSDNQNLYDFMKASQWLNENAKEASIAYSGFNFPYHLYGRDFSRKVDYVNINECAECRYFDYRDSPNSIRRDPNYQHWIQNLRQKNKEYLVVNPVITRGIHNYEFEWANQHPDNFEKVFNLNDIHIYRIFY